MSICLVTINAWTIDSTVKTNQFTLSFYAAVAPNNMGVGIPLWYMLYCSNQGSKHEQFALETCLKIIFARMLSLRPNVIMIDKSWIEYNAIPNVTTYAPQSWVDVVSKKKHKSCFLLLCLLHDKKVWIENMLYQP